MTRSLGTASSNPRQTTHAKPQTPPRDGEAAPSDWTEVWLALANRISELARLRAEREAWTEPVRFVYDSHDQATLA